MVIQMTRLCVHELAHQPRVTSGRATLRERQRQEERVSNGLLG